MPPPPPPVTRVIYLHGFASSPSSRKGVFFTEHFAKHGIPVTCVDLRIPSLETLRLSAMVKAARNAIGDHDDRAVVIGSSLGGLTAAIAATRDARICAAVLLAPAFGLASRWKKRIGDEALAQWRDTGWHTLGGDDPDAPPRLHYAFLDDAIETEVGVEGGRRIRVPTLVLHGTKDDVVPIESSRAMVQADPWKRLIELDDGHQLYASLDRMAVEINAFLHLPPR